MRITKFLMLAVFAATTTLASAQFANTSNSSSGRRSGGTGVSLSNDCSNYNRFSFGYMGTNFHDSEDSDYDYTLKGFTMSYVRGINLTNKLPLFLEVGGELNYGTWHDSDDEDEFRDNKLSLAVPVNLTYKLGFNNGMYIAPYAGIHLDLGLVFNAKEKEYDDYYDETETYTYSYYSEKDMGFNRFQVGYQIGANIGYKAFHFGVGYRGDFTPIYKEHNYKITTGGPVITMGYNF